MKNLLLRFFMIIFFTAIGCNSLFAGATKAPANVQAALFIKLLAFNKGLASVGSFTVYVLGDSAFAGELKKAEGKKVGPLTLAKVEEGAGLPGSAPHVLYIGDEGQFEAASKYTQDNKILSITGIPDLVKKGVSLGVGIMGGKPKIFINLESSKAEGINWNPAILKLAQKV